MSTVKVVFNGTADEFIDFANRVCDDKGPQLTPVSSENSVFSTEDVRQVLKLMHSGNKIDAIKLVRAKSGLGLKESKDLVEGVSP